VRSSAFLFCLFNAVILHAQVLPHKKYTSRDGLIADRITTIAQDEKGFMWFGSYFGICRYDGLRFEKLVLPPSQQFKFVNCIVPAYGKVYAGFLFGGGLMEYSDGLVRTYFITDRPDANNFLCMFPSGDGNLLVANSNNEIFSFREGSFRLLYTLKECNPGGIVAFQKDGSGNLWIATNNGLRIITREKEQFTFFKGQNVFNLARDKEGCIWIAYQNNRETFIENCDGFKEGSMTGRKQLSKISGIRSVAFGGGMQQGFWMVSNYNGLNRVMAKGQVDTFSTSLNLKTDVNIVFNDRENNIWIANEPGVLKISDLHTRSYPFEELAPAGGSLALQDSVVWASNSKYLYQITGNEFRKVPEFRSPYGYIGFTYIDAKKRMWATMWDGGIWCITFREGKIAQRKFYDAYKGTKIMVQGIAEDSTGNLWLGGSMGLFRMKDDKIVEHKKIWGKDGRPIFITALCLDEKNQSLWLGDNTAGVVQLKYDQAGNGTFRYRNEAYIHVAQGLTDPFVRSMLLDRKGNLWIGSRSGGIFCVDTKLPKSYRAWNMNAAAGLSCARITQIIEEGSTAVWFAACDGIYRYHQQTKTWEQYNTSDGLQASEVFSIALHKKTGTIWALCSEGVTALKTTREKSLPPLVSITSVMVLGKADTTALTQSGVRSFSHNRNSIGFSFAGVSFIDEKNIQYRYMLDGYDKDWSAPVRTNTVNYASLPSGNYRFKVIAANAKGIWTTEPAVYPFKIVVPLYQRSWFIFLCITLLIFLIYLVRIQRLRQKYKIEKLRLSIAQDLHDDIGSALGSINLMSQTASRRLEKNLSPHELNPVFQKIGRSAQDILESMDDIVWAINPDKDKVEDLVVRMREFAIPLLESRSIEFEFRVGVNDYRKLSMDLRRNVFLIFKETIYNAIRHSEAGFILTEMQLGHHLVLTVKDNGKGFNPEVPSGRNGLKNLHKRAATVGGTLYLTSGDSGTQVRFSCPIR
jgi:ligand-binding sensor domain-containing protein